MRSARRTINFAVYISRGAGCSAADDVPGRRVLESEGFAGGGVAPFAVDEEFQGSRQKRFPRRHAVCELSSHHHAPREILPDAADTTCTFDQDYALVIIRSMRAPT
jgi:hypothetical protein